MRVLQFRAIFLSDIHLGTRDARVGHLLDFLNNTESEYLYLLGDVVDFWKAKSGWYWPRQHTEVLQAILHKARRGTRVIYIPGNHDEWLRDHARSEFNGIELRLGTVHHTADGRRFLLLHGDEFDGAVRCNRMLSRLGSSAYDMLLWLNRIHHQVRRHLGFPYWSLSSWIKNRIKNAATYVQSFELAALREAERHGVNGVICGHIHQPGIRHGAGLCYANAGDWVEHCSALAEDHEGRLHLIHWAEDSLQWLQATEVAAAAPDTAPA